MLAPLTWRQSWRPAQSAAACWPRTTAYQLLQCLLGPQVGLLGPQMLHRTCKGACGCVACFIQQIQLFAGFNENLPCANNRRCDATLRAELPCNAGLVTGVLGALIVLSLLWKELRSQDLLGSSLIAVAAVFALGHFVPILDNRCAAEMRVVHGKSCLCKQAAQVGVAMFAVCSAGCMQAGSCLVRFVLRSFIYRVCFFASSACAGEAHKCSVKEKIRPMQPHVRSG